MAIYIDFIQLAKLAQFSCFSCFPLANGKVQGVRGVRSLKMRQVENKIPVASANNLLKFNAVEKGARRQLTTIKRENQREQGDEKRQWKMRKKR